MSAQAGRPAAVSPCATGCRTGPATSATRHRGLSAARARQVLWHPQRGQRRQVRQVRQVVLQRAHHRHGLMHRPAPGAPPRAPARAPAALSRHRAPRRRAAASAHMYGVRPERETALQCRALDFYASYGCPRRAGEGTRARVPAAPRLAAGRRAAGVLRVRQPQCVRAGLRAGGPRDILWTHSTCWIQAVTLSSAGHGCRGAPLPAAVAHPFRPHCHPCNSRAHAGCCDRVRVRVGAGAQREQRGAALPQHGALGAGPAGA